MTDSPIDTASDAPVRVSPRVLPSPAAQVPYTLRVAAEYGWRLGAVAIMLYLIGIAVGALSLLIVAIFLALTVSALVLPLCNLLDRFTPRPVAVALALLISAAVVLAALIFIVLGVVDQVPALVSQIQSGFQSVLTWLQTGPLKVNTATLEAWVGNAQAWLASNVAGLASGVAGGLGAVASIGTALALSFFATVFFMLEGGKIFGWCVDMTPRQSQERLRVSGELAWTTFAAYTRGIVLIAAVDAFLVGIALTVLKVPLPIPLALLVFFGSFIPYIGAPIAMFAAALVALAANGPLSFVLVIALITIIGQIEGNVMQPLIMSKQVSLYPLVTVLSVAVGTAIAGIIGAIVAVPIVSVFWAVARYVTNRDPDHPAPAPYSQSPVDKVIGDWE